MPPAESHKIRFIAYYEAVKGSVTLLTGTGCFTLLHRDVHALAAGFVEHSHLNPASKIPRVFLDLASNLDDRRLMALAAGATAYAVIALLKAYGLLKGRAWAEMLAAVGAAIYVPFEIMELVRRPSWHALLLLVVNLLVVAVMVRAIAHRRAQRAGAMQQA